MKLLTSKVFKSVSWFYLYDITLVEQSKYHNYREAIKDI